MGRGGRSSGGGGRGFRSGSTSRGFSSGSWHRSKSGSGNRGSRSSGYRSLFDGSIIILGIIIVFVLHYIFKVDANKAIVIGIIAIVGMYALKFIIFTGAVVYLITSGIIKGIAAIVKSITRKKETKKMWLLKWYHNGMEYIGDDAGYYSIEAIKVKIVDGTIQYMDIDLAEQIKEKMEKGFIENECFDKEIDRIDIVNNEFIANL